MLWDSVRWGINVLNLFDLCVVGVGFGLLWPRMTLWPCFSPRGSTDVFICTSPIKKYRYCPYEKVSRPKSQLPLPSTLPSERCLTPACLWL